MTFLLDTHVWLWLFEESEQIPGDIAAVLKAPKNMPLGVAAISPWEIAKKASLGKLRLSCPVRDWVENAAGNAGIEVVPLSPGIACEANELPQPFHRDPADQMIVATARLLDLTLITCDRKILAYPHVKTIWG